MQLEDLILVSVDDHAVEPPDLFEGRLPQKYAEVAPRLVRKDIRADAAEPATAERGSQREFIDVWQFMGAELPNIGPERRSRAVRPRSTRWTRSRSTTCGPVVTTSTNRVKDMNANGLLGSMCFPSFPQFCGQLFARAAKKDEPLASRWSRRTTTGTSRAVRRVPGPLHSPRAPDDVGRRQDGGRSAARRRQGLPRGDLLRKPGSPRLPSIHSGHWDTFFATCEEVGTVVNVHIGSSSKMVITADDAPMSVLITLSPINIVQAAADFVWSASAQKYRS